MELALLIMRIVHILWPLVEKIAQEIDDDPRTTSATLTDVEVQARVIQSLAMTMPPPPLARDESRIEGRYTEAAGRAVLQGDAVHHEDTSGMPS